MNSAKKRSEEQAFKAIDEVIRTLRELNSGKEIPERWKKRLLKALLEPRLKSGAGRKVDARRTASIACALAALTGEQRTHSKQNKPGKRKAEIAKANGVKLRTVNRVADVLDHLDATPAKPEMRKAVITGWGAHVIREQHDEDVAKQKKKVRKDLKEARQRLLLRR